jgi:hypothetical protein
MQGPVAIVPGDAAPALADPGHGASPAEVARFELATLKNDRTFAAELANPSAPGYRAAVDRMSKLHQAAYPEDASGAPAAPAGPAPEGEPNAPDPKGPASPPTNWPLKFSEDTPISTQQEAHALVSEGVATLGLDRELARSAISLISTAQEKRNGAPWTQADLDRFDAILEQKWGADHAAKGAAVKAALTKAGRSGEWLRQSLLAVDPTTAAWVFDTLANQLARSA